MLICEFVASYFWPKQGFILVTHNPKNWWGIRGKTFNYQDREFFLGFALGRSISPFQDLAKRMEQITEMDLRWMQASRIGWGLQEDPVGFVKFFIGRTLWHSWVQTDLKYSYGIFFFWMEDSAPKDIGGWTWVSLWWISFQLNMPVWLHIHDPVWSPVLGILVSSFSRHLQCLEAKSIKAFDNLANISETDWNETYW